MKKNWKIIVGITCGFLLLFFIIKTTKSHSEPPFNVVQLDNSIIILNGLEKPYLDTIINIGLNQLNIQDVIVTLLPMEDYVIDAFKDGGIELKAYLKEKDGLYYIFMLDMDRKESIDVLSHELIHIKQYHDNRLFNDINNDPIWLGERYPLDLFSYEDRPWEKEAFSLDKELNVKISSILY